MASLYPKKNSPYWYLQELDPLTGKNRNRSTGLRIDDEEETRKAKALRAAAEMRELTMPRGPVTDQWGWVSDFLTVRYGARSKAERDPQSSLTRYRNAWTALSAYFRERHIHSPRVLTRDHCMEYIVWRSVPDAEGKSAAMKEGLRKVCHNTALLELKTLALIMREAVNRGRVAANPCLQLGIGKQKQRKKPAITDDEAAKITELLNSPDELSRPYNEAMRIAWEVAMLQCCRISETCVWLANVNFTERTITFGVKGNREHTAMLHPKLAPLFRNLIQRRGLKAFAYDMPKALSRKWRYFFDRHGMHHLTFHCTRVTGATRLRRAGVDRRVAREFVGHSSELIHAIYVRELQEDQLDAVHALALPSPSSSGKILSCETTDSPRARRGRA